MENNQEEMDVLIAKFISKEINPEEFAILESWKNSSEANKQYFDQSINVFSRLRSINKELKIDTDGAWNKLNEKIGHSDGKVIPFYHLPNFSRIAATILILISFGTFAFYLLNKNEAKPVLYSSLDSVMTDTLPDGSKVILNKHSSIEYVKGSGHSREVKLKGEAYFEVVHNENEPFVVHTEDLLIRDIGTAFNVKAIPGSDKVVVVVESGIVQFYSANDSGVRLNKGEKAEYDKSQKIFTKSDVQNTENQGSFRSRNFYFDGTLLKEVVRQIGDVYTCDIRLNPESIGSCPVSVQFKNESLEVVFRILSETLDLEVVRKDSTVWLKGKACLK